MDFAYTPRLLELQARAAALTAQIMPHEEACEADNGLSAQAHAAIRGQVLDRQVVA